MRPRTLFLCRGPSGSGKSSLAHMLAPGHAHAADDFFETPDGGYLFDPAKLPEAHAACVEKVDVDMQRDVPFIAVHNTMSQAWEARAYFELARRWDYTVFIVEAQNDFGNIHGVPPAIIAAMRDRWEPLDRPAPSILHIIRTRMAARWRALKNKVRALVRTSRRSVA